MKLAGTMTGERRGARGALAPWALVLAALLLAPFAEASLPRPAAMDGAALRIASLAEPSRLAPLAASDDVERFALFAGDELAPEPAPLALASRVRENRFSLHLGVDVFGLEPLRGPPPLSEDLCQGDDECLAGTRIGGLGLLEPFAQNAEPELTLGLLPGYQVSTSGLAYGKPLDPWGLAVSVTKKGVMIASENLLHSPIEHFSWDWAAAHPDQFYALLTKRGGMNELEAGKLMADHGVMPGGQAGREFFVRQVARDSKQLEDDATELWVSGMLGLGVDRAVTAAGRKVAASYVERRLAKEAAGAAKSVGLSSEGAKTGQMAEAQFNRIKTSVEAKGGVIDQSADAQRYLQARGAEAATLNESTMLMKTNPSSAEVFEELIHTAQYRTGRATGANVTAMEIEAAEKLLRYQGAYGISAADAAVIEERLQALRILQAAGH